MIEETYKEILCACAACGATCAGIGIGTLVPVGISGCAGFIKLVTLTIESVAVGVGVYEGLFCCKLLCVVSNRNRRVSPTRR